MESTTTTGDSVVLGGAGALLLLGFGQRPKQARRIATRLAAGGAPASAELRVLLEDRPSLAANYASAALVLVILVLMVFKP